MSYLGAAAPGTADPPILEAINRSFGFIPNFFRVQARRADLVEAEVAFIDALVGQGTLPRAVKEYVFLVCSAANLSTYCVTLHCEIVRMLGISGPEPEQIALNHAATNLPMRVKALLTFALKLNGGTNRVGAADIEGLRTYGYSDDQILEAVLVVALARFANAISIGLGTVPDFPAVQLPGLGAAAGAKIT